MALRGHRRHVDALAVFSLRLLLPFSCTCDLSCQSCTSARFRWPSQRLHFGAMSTLAAMSWTIMFCCTRHRPVSGCSGVHRQKLRSFLGFCVLLRVWKVGRGQKEAPSRPIRPGKHGDLQHLAILAACSGLGGDVFANTSVQRADGLKAYGLREPEASLPHSTASCFQQVQESTWFQHFVQLIEASRLR